MVNRCHQFELSGFLLPLDEQKEGLSTSRDISGVSRSTKSIRPTFLPIKILPLPECCLLKKEDINPVLSTENHSQFLYLSFLQILLVY